MSIGHRKSSLVRIFALAGVAALTACDERGVGDRAADGAVRIREKLVAAPADAAGLHTWNGSAQYCQDLISNGHDDWVLPTMDQLNWMYQHKDTGAFAGTFKDRAQGNALVNGNTVAHWYWSAEEHPNSSDHAGIQSFSPGGDGWGPKEELKLSVRCVRAQPAVP